MKALRSPLLLFLLPAALAGLAPGPAESLLLSTAAVDAGEVWRLWTGHWVHFTPTHAAWNLGVLLVVGAWLERVRPGLLVRFTLIAAPLLALAVLAFEPALVAYGGLSGLATALVVRLALDRATAGGVPWPWVGVLVLVVVKLLAESAGAGALFAGLGDGVRPSAVAHAAGAVLGAVDFVCATHAARAGRESESLQTEPQPWPVGRGVPAEPRQVARIDLNPL